MNGIDVKLNYLKETKELIRQAIIEQGVEVPTTIPFAEYPRCVLGIGGESDYRAPNLRDGTVAGELKQIINTKQALASAITEMGVEVPNKTPFRKYSELIGDITTTPTLDSLKKALNNGTAMKKFPVMTEIPDIYDGNENPLFIAQYLTATNNSSYGNAEGVILLRKFVEPVSQTYGANAQYEQSTIKSLLDNAYFNKCSDELKSVISEIDIPYYNLSADTVVNLRSKLFLPSATELCGYPGTGIKIYEGIGWEYFVNKTGLLPIGPNNENYSNNNDNSGRIMSGRDGINYNIWLRSRANHSNVMYVTTNGAIKNVGPTAKYGIIHACFMAKGAN